MITLSIAIQVLVQLKYEKLEFETIKKITYKKFKLLVRKFHSLQETVATLLIDFFSNCYDFF